MRPVDWFGGYVRAGAGPTPVPLPARQLHPEPMLWTAGDLPARVASRSGRAAAVFGHCSMSDHELVGLTEGADDPLGGSNPLGWMNPVGWSGCYTVVRCDPTATRILTDPAGAQPVYVARSSGGLLWGSSARALSALLGGRIDEDYLRARLPDVGAGLPTGTDADRPADSLAAGLERSPYAGVWLVPPGSWVRLTGDGEIDLRQAWQPRDRSTSDGIMRLRAALAGGVRTRTSELARVTADCSGGLDSTTICLLCDPSQVTAVSVRPPNLFTGGDLDYARAVDLAYPMLKRQQVVVSEAQLPYTGLLGLPATDEPPRSVTVFSRTAHICEVLREVGSDLHLTGDGADVLLAPPLSYLSRLSRWHPLRAWRHARGWAYLTEQSPWRLRDPGSRLQRVREAARSAASDQQLVASLGLRYSNPFFDNQVVDAVLGVRADRYASPYHYKPLLVSAFSDLLPPTVAGRGTKAIMVADHYRGIRANLEELLSLLDGDLAARGLIDPPWLRDQVRDAAAGIPVALGMLETVLGTEAWLRAVYAAEAPRWEWI